MGYVTDCLRNHTAGLKQIKVGLPNERADETLCGGQSGWEVMPQRGCRAQDDIEYGVLVERDSPEYAEIGRVQLNTSRTSPV